MKNYLLEIGLEEIPARFLNSISEQLKERMIQFLDEQQITYDEIVSYATPRRLAVMVKNIAEYQPDRQIVVKGPAMKIAKNEQGEWSKAAEGFMKGQNIQPEETFVEAVKGVDYLYGRKQITGKPVEEVLQDIPQILNAMTFPVTMLWNELEIPFIRPVHWIVSMLDDKIIPFTFIQVQASNQTYGHRFLGKQVTLHHADDYVEQLRQQYVIVDSNERKMKITQQLKALEQENGWDIPIDEDLLDEVVAIVEWPTIFYGTFDEKYLQVPEIVLITAMRDHQRYFYAMRDGKLLPLFISVRNGNDAHIENVIKGNQKVLRARLEDALFFYQEDLKKTLSDYLEKLEHVNEHYLLGTLADKQRHVKQFLDVIGKWAQVDQNEVEIAQQAAQVYKYDLMTQTVGEFDELQGEIGAIYAPHYQLSKQVALAIKQHYWPKGSQGELPTTTVSRLLAFADKLDTLINYFSISLIPTGSNDPYALRRQAMGIVEIILASNWQGDMATLLQQHPKVAEQADLLPQIIEFLFARLNVILENKNIDYDIIQAITMAKHVDFVALVRVAETLQHLKDTTPNLFRNVIEAVTRVVNLGDTVINSEPVNRQLAQTESERQLIDYIERHSDQFIVDYLIALQPLIEVYFEENMVNHEQEVIKKNRYAIMAQISQRVLTSFDPRKVISKF